MNEHILLENATRYFAPPQIALPTNYTFEKNEGIGFII